MLSRSQVKHIQQHVLEVLVSRNHPRQVLEVTPELLQPHLVVRLYVVPTPHELVKRILLRLTLRQHLRVPLRVENLPQLLQCHPISCHLLHPVVRVHYRLLPVLVQLPS